jgi:sporulation protein YlmC with PRC-barrel domain
MNYEERDNYGMYRPSNTHATLGPGLQTGPGPHLMGADTLIGNTVVNHKDENVGDIKEIMLDVPNGRIVYAVLSFGGFLSMGEKLFAVPWGALKLDTSNKRFVLNVDKERLEKAPGFDKDKWPDMADPSWTRKVHSYYGTQPFGDEPTH